jgi:hypothetical protein
MCAFIPAPPCVLWLLCFLKTIYTLTKTTQTQYNQGSPSVRNFVHPQ